MAYECAGGVCTSGSSPSSPQHSTWTYNIDPVTGENLVASGERYGGQKTLGDYYRMYNLLKSQRREEKLAYESVLRQFTGPESTWIRWLIKQRASGYKDMSAMAVLGRTEQNRFADYTPPAVPDWMQEYIVPITTEQEAGRGRGTTTKTSYELRPLSPTSKLNAEQQQLMAGWLSWQKAGAPTRYNEDIFPLLSDIERYWSPYTTESQAMFSKAPTKPRWATATQGR